MESLNKKNMALKLEMWLSAKQSGGVTPIPSPLRNVIHTTSSQRRVSGFLTNMSAGESTTKSRRKSFSRSILISDEDLPSMSSSSSTATSSPLRKLSLDKIQISSSPKVNQFVIFSENNNDENSKENHPCQDQNVASNVTRSKITKSLTHSMTAKHSPSDQPLKEAIILEKPLKSSSSKSTPELLDHTEFTTEQHIPPRRSEQSFGSPSIDSRHCSIEAKSSKNSSNHHNQSWDDLEKRASYFHEELQAMTFLNSILEQRVAELEQTISQDRLETNETVSNRGKKHKLELKRLAQERSSYEERANQMVTQMGEQMALLQSMAMGRIEILENDLMTERHTAEALTQEVACLRSTLAANRDYGVESSVEKMDSGAIADDSSDGNIDTETDTTSCARADDNDMESDADYSLTDDAASDEEDSDNVVDENFGAEFQAETNFAL